MSVWTGREWLLLGTSSGADGAVDAGLAYDPASGAWRQVDPGPLRGSGTGAAWTGREVLAFGPGQELHRYDVATDRWTAANAGTLRLAGARDGAPVVVWTGSRLLVWGGARERDTFMCFDAFDDAAVEYGGSCNPATGPLGAAYDPVTDSWEEFTDGPWQRRVETAAVWMGDGLLLSGGRDLEIERRGGEPSRAGRTRGRGSHRDAPVGAVRSTPTVRGAGRAVCRRAKTFMVRAARQVREVVARP